MRTSNLGLFFLCAVLFLPTAALPTLRQTGLPFERLELAKLRVGNLVDPNYAVVVKIPKRLLPKRH